MAVRNFFSGCEGDHHFQQAIDNGAKHVLMSFLHLQKHGTDLIKCRKEKNPEIKFLIDSGAHTLQVSTGKPPYNTWTHTDYTNYVKEYVKWLKENRKYIFAAVELDIDYCVGTGVVEQWQKRYFEPLQELGMDICYVWHKERGLEEWEAMCARFSYVGLPGEMSSDSDFNKYLTVARRYTTRVHGFAATKQSDFRDWPWYSIDSITWKTSEIYGTLIVWNEQKQKLKFEQDKTKRRKYYRIMQAMGFNAEAICKDSDYKEVTRFALRSMTAMEEFYRQKYKHRTFYYQLRLPHPNVLKRFKDKKVWRTWKLFTPEKNFTMHADERSVSNIRCYLKAISAVQNWVPSIITADPSLERDFLKTYFQGMVDPQLASKEIFKKELAMATAPPNPPPLARTELSHFIASNNVPKPREAVVYTLADLTPGLASVPFLLKDL